jgi:hypothetical protein
MDNSPQQWSLSIQPVRFTNIEQLKKAFMQYEGQLIKDAIQSGWPRNRGVADGYSNTTYQNYKKKADSNKKNSRALAAQVFAIDTRSTNRPNPPPRSFPIGWGDFKPQFPRNDKVVSKGRTPRWLEVDPAGTVGAPNTGTKIAPMQKKVPPRLDHSSRHTQLMS